eukprot:TRINITY_DN47218_c0_g1_i1.p1 TRINITY_DN47218_c0_g1~~TRINITY_DN47218_c0_g1_i1.p1  ORF type:complete len:2822 (+),score=450.08 TRINITY_DN47218_c0_g1_i1:71-8536(+)
MTRTMIAAAALAGIVAPMAGQDPRYSWRRQQYNRRLQEPPQGPPREPLIVTAAADVEGRFHTLQSCQTQGGVVCSGHGDCDMTTGNAICNCWADGARGYWSTLPGEPPCDRCEEGYAGDDCTSECPGGSCNQCSNHGTCSQGRGGDGMCTCHSNSTAGFWGSDDCSVCQPGYYKFQCLEACPGMPREPCGGPARGFCFDGTGKWPGLGNGSCSCVQGPSEGFWGNEKWDDVQGKWAQSDCTDCDRGHYGPGCIKECTGGAKTPCRGHGRCRNGINGDGECICDLGWTADDCSISCPGTSSSNQWVCGGKGTCQANGTCVCNSANFALPDCTTCVYGKTGPDCDVECPHNGTSPTDPKRRPCSDHGECGRNQTCTCHSGYAHAQSGTWVDRNACQEVCPGIGSPITPCSSNGKCNPNDNTCTCYDDDTLGHWGGSGCSECAVGWSGAPKRTVVNGKRVERRGCTLPCPGTGNGTVCSGHGDCIEGECFCNQTWCGADCAAMSATPLVDCNQCPVGSWGHSDCSNTCPGSAAPGDAGCSGKGRCRERDNIPSSDATNSCVCRPGSGGDDCSKECPKSGSDSCGGPGRGICNMDDFTCQCKDGFAGANCGMACPFDPISGNTCGGNVCYDNSFCIASGGTVCPNLKLPTCAIDCSATQTQLPSAFPPGAQLGGCNCSATAERVSADFTHKGFVGERCTTKCDCTTLVHGLIKDTGSCLPNGSCACDQWADAPRGNYSGGNWAGLTPDVCDRCQLGWYGENCDMHCGGGPDRVATGSTTGATLGRQCKCLDFWSGEDCSRPCFGVNLSTRQEGPKEICAGHGTCQWGAEKSGKCACYANATEAWYPPENCTTRCSVDACSAGGAGSVTLVWDNQTATWLQRENNDGGLQHAQCNPRNGYCECQDDDAGHWAGPQCDECKVKYWGTDCNSVCDCSDHGGCETFTGVCQCFGEKWGGGEEHGYWDGNYCERCADGYIGMTCRGKNVRITRTNTVDPRKVMKTEKQSSLWVDEEQAIIYAGGRPVVAISLRVKDGARNAFPTFMSISEKYLGCNTQDEGEALRVFGHDSHVFFLMQPDPKRGCPWRLLSMPRDVAVGDVVHFGRATEVARGDLAKGSTLVAAHKARGAGVLAMVAQAASSEYYLQRVQLEANGQAKIDASAELEPSELAQPQYGLGTIVAVAVDQTGDNIFLAGSQNASNPDTWGILWVPKTGGACGGVVSPSRKMCLLNHDTHEIEVPTCDGGCRTAMQVRHFAINGRDTLLVPLQSSRGTATGLAQLSLETSCHSGCAAYAEPIVDTALTATALEVDTATEVAYLTINQIQQPSAVYKFEFSPLPGNHFRPKMYGKLDLTWSITGSGFVSEVISALHPAEEWRIMYGLTSDTKVLRLIPLLLYEIRSVTPPLSDTKGGTKLLLQGKGFRSIKIHGPPAERGEYAPVCRLSEDGDPVPATIIGTNQVGEQGWLRNTSITCTAPALNSSVDQLSCDGDPVEVSLYNTSSTYTDNRVLLKRVQSVMLNDTIGAVPDSGFYTAVAPDGGAIMVNLTGFGFQVETNADGSVRCETCLACKFYSETEPDTAVVSAGPDMVTLVSPYHIRCVQPPTTRASIDPSFVDVSLDGQVYSGKPVRFTIVGPPAGLWVQPTLTAVAHWVVNLSTISIHVVDDQGHQLNAYDRLVGGGQRNTSIEVDWYADEAVHGSTNLTLTSRAEAGGGLRVATGTKTELLIPTAMVPSRDGVASFDGVQVLNAVTGAIAFRFRTEDVHTLRRHGQPLIFGWMASAILRVTVGEPHHLKIRTQPSPTTDFVNKLAVQPVLVVVDEIENEIRDTNATFNVECVIVSDPPGMIQPRARTKFESALTQDDTHKGLVLWKEVRVSGRFGAVYRLNFTCKQSTKSGCCPNGPPCWPSVISRDIRPRDCAGCRDPTTFHEDTNMCNAEGGSEYQQLHTEKCFPCPKGGLCNGSSAVWTQPGWWRPAPDAIDFFECKKSKLACIGGAPVYNASLLCDNMTEGPLCEVCKPGFGKTPTGGCGPCSEGSTDLALVVMAAVCVIIGLVVWIVITLRKNKDSAMSIITRMIVSHLQVVGKLGEFSVQWAPFMKELFDMQSSGSQMSISGLQAVDCTMRDNGFNAFHYFIVYMLMPVLPLVIALLVFGFIVARRTIDPSLVPDDGDEKEAKDKDDLEIKEGIEVQDDEREMTELVVKPAPSPTTSPRASKKDASAVKGAHFGDDEVIQEADEDSSDDDEDVEDTNNIYLYNFSQVLLTTYCVCLFVLYPTLITQAALMLSCDKFPVVVRDINSTDYAPMTLSEKQYLRIDRSIDCDMASYASYRTAAVACLVGYGLGIPVAFVALVKLVLRQHEKKGVDGFPIVYIMFIFLLGGFKKESWFWQAVIMIRKLAMGLIAVFVVVDDDSDPTNDALQSYCAMWVMSLALVIHLWQKPYDPYGDAPYNDLETMSLGVLVFMLNAGLLYYWEDLSKPDLSWAKDLLTATLILVTFVCLIVFVYYLVRYGWIPLAVDIADRDCDGKVTARDLRLLFRLEKVLPDISNLDDIDEAEVRCVADKMGVAHWGYDIDDVMVSIREKHAEGLANGMVDEVMVLENKLKLRKDKKKEREEKQRVMLERQRLESMEEDEGMGESEMHKFREDFREAQAAVGAAGGADAPAASFGSEPPSPAGREALSGAQQWNLRDSAPQGRREPESYWPPAQSLARSARGAPLHRGQSASARRPARRARRPAPLDGGSLRDDGGHRRAAPPDTLASSTGPHPLRATPTGPAPSGPADSATDWGFLRRQTQTESPHHWGSAAPVRGRGRATAVEGRDRRRTAGRLAAQGSSS